MLHRGSLLVLAGALLLGTPAVADEAATHYHKAMALKKQGKIEDAKIVSDVMKKAVEPAYNYYKVEAQSVVDKAGIMTGLLVFYVIYTMWWGFAIFYLFDGIGLTMKKAKVKKEV